MGWLADWWVLLGIVWDVRLLCFGFGVESFVCGDEVGWFGVLCFVGIGVSGRELDGGGSWCEG